MALKVLMKATFRIGGAQSAQKSATTAPDFIASAKLDAAAKSKVK
jgi:hypothetical protein